MKSYQLLIIFLTIACIAFSCQPEKDDPETDIKKDILLEIPEGQSAYVGETGNRFYTGSFSQPKDSHLFRLKIREGAKYHLFCINPNVEQYGLNMVLLNSKLEIISVSVNTDNKTEIFFTPSTSEDIYLTVETTTEPFDYSLYMEDCQPTPLSFMGYDWEFSGNWKKTGPQSLEFNGSNSGMFRWIRLRSNVSDHTDMSFTVNAENSFPSFGVIFHGESELKNVGLYKEELPQKGTFFHIKTPDTYWIYNVDRTFIAYNTGTFTIPGMDFKKGINVSIGHANTYYGNLSVNNFVLRNFTKFTLKGIYLVVEDKGFDKVSFEGITMKEDEIDRGYEGKWYREIAEDASMRIYEGREVITFTGNQMEDMLQLYDQTINQWVVYKSAKGTLSMHNSLMNVHIYEACVSAYDSFKSRFTGVLKCDGEEDYSFTSNLPQFWMRKDFIFGYHVSGNQMILTFDKNNDGDYDEDGEIREYSRAVD